MIEKNRRTIREKEGQHKPTRYFSKRQEVKVSKENNGKRMLNSGATMFSKGDVLTDKFLLECKTKTKPSESISIKKEWFDKNRQDSLRMGKKYSAVIFDFGDGESRYIIDQFLFNLLCEYIEQGGDENWE